MHTKCGWKTKIFCERSLLSVQVPINKDYEAPKIFLPYWKPFVLKETHVNYQIFLKFHFFHLSLGRLFVLTGNEWITLAVAAMMPKCAYRVTSVLV